MPFINGKFYMNPAYGRAIEHARQNGAAPNRDAARPPAPEDGGDDGRWVTIDGRHVLIQSAHGGSVRIDTPRNKREAALATIVYNETSSLRADPRAKSGDGGSAEALHDAREGIAEIAMRAIDKGHPEYVAPPELTEESAGDIRDGNQDAIAAYNDSLAVAREALAGANHTMGATQLRVRSPNVDRDHAIRLRGTTFAYGPFRNTIGRPKTVVFAP
jgi:hypothetical protein